MATFPTWTTPGTTTRPWCSPPYPPPWTRVSNRLDSNSTPSSLTSSLVARTCPWTTCRTSIRAYPTGAFPAWAPSTHASALPTATPTSGTPMWACPRPTRRTPRRRRRRRRTRATPRGISRIPVPWWQRVRTWWTRWCRTVRTGRFRRWRGCLTRPRVSTLFQIRMWRRWRGGQWRRTYNTAWLGIRLIIDFKSELNLYLKDWVTYQSIMYINNSLDLSTWKVLLTLLEVTTAEYELVL